MYTYTYIKIHIDQFPLSFLPPLVPEENLCRYVARAFYWLEPLHVIQQAASKHWRLLKELTGP